MAGTVSHPNPQIRDAAVDFIAGLEELVAKPKTYGKFQLTLEGADTKITGRESGILWREKFLTGKP